IHPEELPALAHAEESVVLYAEAGDELAEALAGADIAIDGLLGIGARGAPRPPFDDIIRELNCWHAERGIIVVAVDGPSGVDPDTGDVPGIAVDADLTVVLGGAKRGLLTGSAAAHCGRYVFADIGLIGEPPDAAEVITLDSLAGVLRRPAPESHKYTFGRLLVVASSERYVGAAMLVCGAAMRAGAGVVTLASPRWMRNVVASRLPEVTYLLLPDAGPAEDPQGCAVRVVDQLGDFTALALGPGLSTEAGTPEFVERVLRARAETGPAVVVDADGLNCLARRDGWPAWIGRDVVLTPHLGELRRLAPRVGESGDPPWEIAGQHAASWGTTLVVKGAFTGIGAGGRAWVHAGPNPAMATAGTGDILTGTIGGLLARGVPPTDAARLGVWAHSQAGEVAGGALLAGGMVATELLEYIPAALAEAVQATQRAEATGRG
ncbi:MAG: ADP-dependent NAD(P)H-hydrate dehydratase / NAD(P)H-hydrate epimerase, partial [Chloroflexota bacterium]|nr:ADP-dependent NAD(P)H-hydrate dehydratase / NAD(P)H-hydrate epimerase [Chloroflexota bacterium]